MTIIVDKQVLIVQKTAEYINFRALDTLQIDVKTPEKVLDGSMPLPDSMRQGIQEDGDRPQS